MVTLNYYGYSLRDPSIPLNPFEFLEQEVLPLDKSKQISLSMRFWQAPPSCDELEELMETIQEHNITKLDLSFNRLEDEHAEIIASAVKTSKIGELILTNNAIKDDGARLLADAMVARAPNLIVSLAGNKIGPDSAREIVQAFTKTAATKLDLSNNKLKDEGVKIIAEELQINHGKIDTLILKHNQITDEGDKDLATKVPLSIGIIHRVKSVPFYEKHPYLYVFLGLLFFPLFFLLRLSCCNREVDIEGCKFEQKRRQII